MERPERRGRAVGEAKAAQPVEGGTAASVRLLKHHHEPTVHRACFQVMKDAIDVAKPRPMNMGMHPSFASELDRFGQILPGAHDRTADRDPLQHDVEDRGRELPRRKPDEAHGAPPARQPKRLRKRDWRYRCHKDAMRTAAGRSDDLCDRVG